MMYSSCHIASHIADFVNLFGSIVFFFPSGTAYRLVLQQPCTHGDKSINAFAPSIRSQYKINGRSEQLNKSYVRASASYIRACWVCGLRPQKFKMCIVHRHNSTMKWDAFIDARIHLHSPIYRYLYKYTKIYSVHVRLTGWAAGLCARQCAWVSGACVCEV